MRTNKKDVTILPYGSATLDFKSQAAIRGGDWVKTDDSVVNPNGATDPPPPANS